MRAPIRETGPVVTMPPAGGPLREAAFGADPGADVWWAVDPAHDAAADPGAVGWSRWLAAVVLGGQGHYAAAATVLTGLLAHRDRVASFAASTLASHRRQLGAHRAARSLDALALRRAAGGGDAPAIGPPDPDGIDRAGSGVDALLGLAADAIGVCRLRSARRLLDAATRAAGPAPPWRTAVRLGWLTAEVELAGDTPGSAVEPAERALALARRRGAVRHEAKSRLVLAAALATAGGGGRATELLHEVTGMADRYGLAPLAWPAGLLLDGVAAGTVAGTPVSARERAGDALRLVFARADAPLRAAAWGSLWVPSDMLRTGDSAERSSVGEIHGKYVIRTCQGSTPRDR